MDYEKGVVVLFGYSERISYTSLYPKSKDVLSCVYYGIPEQRLCFKDIIPLTQAENEIAAHLQSGGKLLKRREE